MKGFLVLAFCLALLETALSAEFKVATYNIKGLPFPIQPVHTPRYKKIVKAIRALEQEGKAPDVIFLQEAFSLLTRYVYRNLNDIYPYRVRGPSNRLRINSGLEILSKYPITKAMIVAYGQCDFTDCLARKGALMARIKLPDVGEVDFYNTHLQADNHGRADWRSQNVRTKQTETFLKFIQNTHDESLPFILAGDFNAITEEHSYQMILAQFGDVQTRDFCASSNACPGFSLMPADYWAGRIDHIFYQGLRPLDYRSYFNGTKYSDHDMLMGTYALP